MNQLIQSKNFTTFIVSAVALVCFELSPKAQAVSPAPDGGYPGGNTAKGTDTLLSLSSGVWNTALGFEALNNDTVGGNNTATGVRALFSDTNGSNNSAAGVYALYANINGWYNNAVGAYALANNISGNYNTANGYGALYRNIASYNTANGYQALYSNTTGVFNTANGGGALLNNTTGFQNTATGFDALANSTGVNNIALGFGAGLGVTTANNVIAIGTSGANVSDSCFIGNIRGVTTVNAAIPVLIDIVGQFGTASSSRRFKKEIKPMEQASEAILALKPVTFHYKSDSTGTPQFGLIAEQVAEVNPDLVVRDADGEIYTVRYDAVNAMLLNEFLKEHRKVEELKSAVAKQEAAISQQKKDFQATALQQQTEIQALTASLKEQASQIQRMSAQFELSKPAPNVVLDNP